MSALAAVVQAQSGPRDTNDEDRRLILRLNIPCMAAGAPLAPSLLVSRAASIGSLGSSPSEIWL